MVFFFIYFNRGFMLSTSPPSYICARINSYHITLSARTYNNTMNSPPPPSLLISDPHHIICILKMLFRHIHFWHPPLRNILVLIVQFFFSSFVPFSFISFNSPLTLFSTPELLLQKKKKTQVLAREVLFTFHTFILRRNIATVRGRVQHTQKKKRVLVTNQ